MATSNKMRARDRLPFDFEDGVLVQGTGVDALVDVIVDTSTAAGQSQSAAASSASNAQAAADYIFSAIELIDESQTAGDGAQYDMAIAQSAAISAQGYADNASSVVQQDLSGVTAAALHRSPNAVTAMFLYDTSKDSDGGAWTEKCQHTSWYAEDINGKWLGAQASQAAARAVSGATTGDYFQLTTDGRFYRLWKNLVQNGGDLTQASWGKAALTASVAAIAPPSGVVSGVTRLVADATNAVHKVTATVPYLGIDGSASFYVLASGGRYFGVRTSSTSPARYAFFDLQNPGTVTRAQSSTADFSTATLTDVGGGWFRVTVSQAFMGGASTNNLVIYTLGSQPAAAAGGFNEATLAYTGDGTSGIFVAGVQAEFSLIPTAYEAKAADGSTTEVFRGNKRDFPRLAAIVAEGSNVTIYDLTEPGRPMWMRFVAGAISTFALGWANGGSTVGSLAALSGKLFIGSTTGNNVQADFARDDMRLAYSGSSAHFLRNRSISSRHNIGGLFLTGGDGYPIANFGVNAVAMTVLPDAPVDPVTGLKVPTIAVATGGGVSVIKHNGTVVNSGHTNVVQNIYFDSSSNIYAQTVYGNNSGINFYKSSGALLTGFTRTGFIERFYDGVTNYGIVKSTKIGSAFIGVQTDQSVTNFRADLRNLIKSPFSRIGNSFNVGFMTNLNRRALACETSSGSVIEAEHVQNGNFDSPIGSEWVIGGGWTVTDGVLTVVTASAYQPTYQIVTGLDAGRTYVAELTVTGVFHSCGVYSGIPGSNSLVNLAQLSIKYSQFIAPATGIVYIGVRGGSVAGSQFGIGKVSIKPAIFNGSIANIRNISVAAYAVPTPRLIGTLTKTEVTAAAQLMAYSGFSTANYLQEPYSADLDFGTGEWGVGAWVNVPAVLPLESFPFGVELIPDYKAGFTSQGASIAISGDDVVITADGTLNYPGFYWAINTVVGQMYFVSGSLRSPTTNTMFLSASNGINPQTSINRAGSFSASHVAVSFGFIATATTTYIHVAGTTATSGHEYAAKNISIRAVNSPTIICDRSHTSGTKVNLGVDITGNLTATAYDGITTRTVTTTAAYNTATWLKAEAQYKTDGSLAIVVNGTEVAVTRGTPLLSLNSRYNLLTYTEQFDNAVWVKIGLNAFGSGSIANATATLDPLGGNTSDFIQENNSTGVHEAYYNKTEIQGQLNTYTYVIYAKAAGRTLLNVSVTGFTGNNYTAAIFNLFGNGAIEKITTVGSTTHVSSTIELANNGFYKCTVTVNSPDIRYVFNGLCTSTAPTYDTLGRPSYTGDGTSGIYIWGADLRLAALASLPYRRVGAATDFDYAAPLTIGNSYATDAPFPGSIALLKLSATVPTPEQSIWMYEQEKQMFRDGAQVCLPDSGAILDLTYDDATDKWIAASAANQSEWSGLVRTSVTPVPAGSFSKVTATSGIKLEARTTTNPGVDVTIPSYALREEFLKNAEAQSKSSRGIVTYDYVGGFTASTTLGSTAISSVAGLSYPTSYIGVQITGAGIPTGTVITGVSGTTIYMDKAATATATGVAISFTDFILPVGMEARIVMAAGAVKREGATSDYSRLFDGFKETIRFAVAPGATTWVQLRAVKSPT